MLAMQTFHVVSCLFRGEFGTVMTIHQLSVEMVRPMLQFPFSSLRHPQSFSEAGKDRGVVRIGRYVVSRTASTLVLKLSNYSRRECSCTSWAWILMVASSDSCLTRSLCIWSASNRTCCSAFCS